MDRHVSATEANQNFSRLLAEVRKGETIVVTSRDRPVARIAPVDPEMHDQVKAVHELHDYFRRREPVVVGPWTREELYD